MQTSRRLPADITRIFQANISTLFTASELRCLLVSRKDSARFEGDVSGSALKCRSAQRRVLTRLGFLVAEQYKQLKFFVIFNTVQQLIS